MRGLLLIAKFEGFIFIRRKRLGGVRKVFLLYGVVMIEETEYYMMQFVSRNIFKRLDVVQRLLLSLCTFLLYMR